MYVVYAYCDFIFIQNISATICRILQRQVHAASDNCGAGQEGPHHDHRAGGEGLQAPDDYDQREGVPAAVPEQDFSQVRYHRRY